MAIPIALQLYSVREDCKKDLPGVLKQVKEMGYVGVEPAGYYDYSAADLKKMLDDIGLACPSTHIRLDTLLGDELPKTVEFHAELDCRYLIIPGVPEERRDSIDAWKKTAEVFDGIAERLAPHGMKTGYHNHNHEFSSPSGEIPWEVFFGNTGEGVTMQPDIGNAMHGGADVVPYIERYPGRSLTVHLKEFSATNDKALIGEGDADWKKIFELCESVGGTEWYIVEQESYAHPPMECVDKCLQNLRGMGK